MSQAAAFRGPKDHRSTMSTGRTTVVPTTATDDEFNNKSTSRLRSQKQITELKEKYLDEELQLELLESKLRYRRELLRMRTKAEIAGIRARLQGERNEFEQANGVTTDSVSRLGNYVEGYCTHVERPSAKESDVRPTVVDSAMATGLQLVNRQELPQVELTHFYDHPENYRKCAHQFRFDVKSKVEVDRKYLVYLPNRCKGRAKESIAECTSLPSIRSLVGARKILSGLFGQTHQVSRMILDRRLNDCKIATNNSDAQANSTIEFPFVLPVKVNLQTQWKSDAGRDVLFSSKRSQGVQKMGCPCNS
ncbi:hypothetical protein PHET_12352 [Paragonimus heterotremus]|uniref:Uncharacterized protein n=1 Tax=Paragonimus heterotremus TaxID=100268 RepID=A0A8J4SEJ7_9TREM|nr:hypothetical protein PHET_12352 [Paragonimus heterotremus]